MKRLAQEDSGRHLLEPVSEERRVHRCSIPCDNIADEAIAQYSGEPSCVFDLAECLPPGLRSRFHHFAPDESPAMASARAFNKEQMQRHE